MARGCRWARRSAEHVGVDPLDGPRDEPTRCARRSTADGVDTAQDKTWAQLVDHALSHFIEPRLIEPTFLVDYPVELSPLSRQMPDDPLADGALRGVLRRDGDRERLLAS